MNLDWMLGFILGLLIVVIAALVVRKGLLRRGGKTGTYDERQIAARGRAFAAAYFTLLIYLAAWLILVAMEVPGFPAVSAILPGMLLSITVFVVHCIFHDAYFRCSDQPKAWLWVCAGVGLLNLVIGALRITRGGTLQALLLENANLWTGLMLAVVVGCALVKLAMDRRSEAE